MPRLMIALAVLLLCPLAGCGIGTSLEYTDHSRDPERFAQLVKQTVVESVADARKSREPADQVRVITLMVTGSGKPVGSYGPVYDELRTKSESLVEAMEAADGRTPDMSTRLDELLTIADQLPGDFKPVEEPRL